MSHRLSASKNKVLLANVLGMHNPSLLHILLLVSFIVFLGWFADTTLLILYAFFDKTVTPLTASQLWVGLTPLPTLLMCVYLKWKWTQKRVISLRANEVDVQAHEGVIMFLSNLSDACIKQVSEGSKEIFDNRSFSWMQNKRGLTVHKQKLQKVWVVCSPNSAPQFKLFQGLFKDWFPHVEFIQVGGEQGIAFDDLKVLSEHLDEVFQNLSSDIDETEVIIDITSGTKTATISGLLTSMVSDHREIQYVLQERKKGQDLYHVKTYKYTIGFFGKGVKSIT